MPGGGCADMRGGRMTHVRTALIMAAAPVATSFPAWLWAEALYAGIGACTGCRRR